ncbi:pre-mRNA-splicing factor slu7 [Anaeramoeba ignava]|uniref:Pre-mRNA-splicing factor SLU7 n=1 Tax=Anaeramoeba ignava TaxID=1746090 RepID=A0A9Q0RFU9_ANAIG|nr:pre-mRNA-splicing factor slu7 [Anaeramoeba ignava]
MASHTNRLSREDFHKQKELEQARKDGTAAPEKDEDGAEINPHIPQYIAQAPWYLSSGRPSLRHQRLNKPQQTGVSLDQWYKRGKTTTQATKYRKGACENCGAMTHSTKDCTERPRKRGAKWTGSDIKPDEYLQAFDLDYDSKRDRWNGYDPKYHSEVIRKFELLEDERKKIREKELKEKVENSVVDSPNVDEDLEDGKVVPFQKLDVKTRTTVRDLRIRKTLLNIY